MARPPASISLREVYMVLGERGDLVPGPQPSPHSCLLAAAIGDALDGAYAEAEALLLRRLDEITVADLVGDLRYRITARAEEIRKTDLPTG
jgi:DNA-binding IscR family transcriptional regulator